MSAKTTYTCDLCGAAQDEPEQFWVVTVALDHYPGPAIHSYISIKRRVEMCRACTERLGFHERYDMSATKPAVPPPPSLEDLLRELLSRVGVEPQS